MSDQMLMPFLGEVEKKQKRHRLIHPVDAVVTFAWNYSTLIIALAALSSGLQLGISSKYFARDGVIRNWSRAFLPMTFVDNEWKEYDHGKHLAAVARLKPKYATVRDYLTPEDAQRAGVEYYSLDTILKWAEELHEYADEVIIIPKADVIADIPEEYVLGYSVPTSYGGTPMPISAFAGRKIHLLGGSWARQRALLDEMGDDIVSIDFNVLLKTAQYGGIVLPDGGLTNLDRIRWGDDEGRTRLVLPNKWTACAIISFGFISAALEDEYLPRSGRSMYRPTDRRQFIPQHDLRWKELA